MTIHWRGWLGFVVFVVVAAAGSMGYVGARWYQRQLQVPSVMDAVIDVQPGATTHSVIDQLSLAGVVPHSWVASLEARRRGVDRRLQAGRYRISAGTTTSGALDMLVNGRVAVVERTVPEGLTLHQAAKRLFPRDEMERARFEALASGAEQGGSLVPAGLSLEGYLFPDTYVLHEPPVADEAISAMLANFERKVGPLQDAVDASGFSLHEIVVLGSIIEAEARVADERTRIAAVYHNRLKKNMKLEADPTVAYILNKIGKRLLFVDLEVESPYNTYRYKGLPPGPINSPGLASIEAALAPSADDDLYFVHRGDGHHVFTRTYDEHREAVREARRWRNR